MNNTSTNYPYLSGYLESVIKNLAYDAKFLSFKKNDDAGRENYLRNLIKEAHVAAIKFESK
jgi:hypothetical protein